ncbi:hypothetical protein DIJ64_05010 [Mycobacterium leprae]|uniref:FAD/NAD(P)-binding domain-containing protein n=1 Tax=Mycobacterium leprae TaxID=1769 RepID=A0AAD0KQR9_MYCLR|nr:hypothetical protein [Mycobacterium leprae]AWV47672.1 hypothetical protein DIJ64_05010 [Mycobacterium leprae]OAR19703.1 hypothetical protein A8144_13725 [Mycobacterium leprae 3125609]OAX70150.1 hypothetical protein A3216_13715 [Mycobacterium leprae 7935681]
MYISPAGVWHVTAEVIKIDTNANTVITSSVRPIATADSCWPRTTSCSNPPFSGLRECSFDVDNYDDALELEYHLHTLTQNATKMLQLAPAPATVIVIGAGLTGMEAACELTSRIRTLFALEGIATRVVLIYHNRLVGSDGRVGTAGDRANLDE